MENEMEYRVPARVLTNRDPVILNKLSFREFFQWGIFFILIYLSFNSLPLDFTFKLITGVAIATFAALFIHSPINGLAGIEWVYIFSRFAFEKKQHRTAAPIGVYSGTRPVYSVSFSPRKRLISDEFQNLAPFSQPEKDSSKNIYLNLSDLKEDPIAAEWPEGFQKIILNETNMTKGNVPEIETN